MSELMNTNRNGRDYRWHLLSTVSALALIASTPDAIAGDDSDHPTVWIELGGQLEQVDSAQSIFSPPFFNIANAAMLAPMVEAQKAPRYAVGGEGKLTFAPEDSNWVFSVSVRYGRSNASKHLHYQSNKPVVPFTNGGNIKYGTKQAEFSDGMGNAREAHFILDFSAGKDVGLGMFGKGSASVLSAGVRFAQFSAGSDVTLLARPVYGSTAFGIPGKYTFHSRFLQNNTAVLESRRSMHALGPSVSWNSSVPIAGNDSSMNVALDWGVNAAVLFGRQHTHTHRQTSGVYYKGFAAGVSGMGRISSYANRPPDQNRSRFVTIPNVGGFAGASFRYANAKISFGYRADFFFGAMDTGIDAAKKSNVGFHGPFATVSVGLGG